jgi:hypothetical protein
MGGVEGSRVSTIYTDDLCIGILKAAKFAATLATTS